MKEYALVPREILSGLVEFARNAGVAHHIVPDDYSASRCDDLLKRMEDSLEAVRLLEAAEAFHANCEDCNDSDNHVPEQCEHCFPYFDTARVKRREVMAALARESK